MLRVEQIWGFDDYDVYYKFVGSETEYCLTENPELLGRVSETIRKYHEEP